MKTKMLVVTLLAGICLFAADQPTATLDTAAAFARLKGLAGEWQADTPQGKGHLSYTVIAGGATVVERESAENMPEMMTVYHLDGKRLMLTHYCAAGNQPRMQAESYDPASGELKFRFLDATNLANADAGHMRNVTLRFVDDAKLVSQWEFYQDGKPKFTEQFEYKRVR